MSMAKVHLDFVHGDFDLNPKIWVSSFLPNLTTFWGKNAVNCNSLKSTELKGHGRKITQFTFSRSEVYSSWHEPGPPASLQNFMCSSHFGKDLSGKLNIFVQKSFFVIFWPNFVIFIHFLPIF